MSWLLHWLLAVVLALIATRDDANDHIIGPETYQPATSTALPAEPTPTVERYTPSAETPLPVDIQQPKYTACLTDEAGVGVTTAWALENVLTYWGVAGAENCVAPDLTIAIRDLGDLTYCGWQEDGGLMTLNSRCFMTGFIWLGHDLSGAYVGVVALLHEWGHFAGLPHGDAPSVMYPVTVYLPTDADRAAIALFTKR